MRQSDLFETHLDRVTARIGAAILSFVTSHPTFRADDLRQHVTATVGAVAPGSADRILRKLRSEGALNYRVLNRRDSLYQAI